MKKNKTRRTFIKKGIKFGIAMPILGHTLISCGPKNKTDQAEAETANQKLNILILGGTSFLGPHQIAYAMERGHKISIFTRGKTKPSIYKGLFENVEQLIGDRSSDLSALENREWDVVIDNSGHNVEWTKKTANLLKEKVGIYMYTSSTGVFYPYLGDHMKEDHKLLLEEPVGIEDEDMKVEYWYGVMKANSELETIKAFGEDRSIIIRPTYMIGPADKSNRFIYWPIRLSHGGEVMIPGKKEDPVQYIDVRDVAEWFIRLAEEKVSGTFNAVGPHSAQTMQEFVHQAKESFEAESTFVNIDDYDFLKVNKVPYIVPWIMPVGNNYGSARIANAKAIENGLTFRSLDNSIKDIFQWWNSDAVSDEKRNNYEADPESILNREKEILQKWKAKSS